MNMDGFGSNLVSTSNCLVLLFKGWVLDTEAKFAFGCLGTAALAFFVEGLVAFRRDVLHHKRVQRAIGRNAQRAVLAGVCYLLDA